jgi:hypothetical protein
MSNTTYPKNMRKIALWGGLLYLVTFAASIPQLKLFKNAVDNPDYLSTASGHTGLLVGACLEVITALAGIGTAVALYPVTRRISSTAAIGFVTSRVIETAMIMVGALSMLSLVTLHHDFGGATGSKADALSVANHSLVAMRQWTFALGPGLMPAVNAMFLGYAMYRSGLIPRILPTIGFIGAPILVASTTATIFGAWSQTSHWAALFAMPIAAWEFSLGVYLTFKGFRSTPEKSADVPATVAAEPVSVS